MCLCVCVPCRRRVLWKVSDMFTLVRVCCWVYMMRSGLLRRTPCLLDQVIHLGIHDCRRDFVCERPVAKED